jgi:hypothetical protein
MLATLMSCGGFSNMFFRCRNRRLTFSVELTMWPVSSQMWIPSVPLLYWTAVRLDGLWLELYPGRHTKYRNLYRDRKALGLRSSVSIHEP